MEAEQSMEGYPMPMGINNHSTEGSLRFQLDVEEQIEILSHNIKGELPKLQKDGSYIWQVPKGMLPLINSKGADNIIGMLRLNLSRIFTLSDFDEEEIEKMTFTFGRTVKDNIIQNWDYYEIADDTAASMILHAITDAYYANLCKARNGKYLRFLSTTTSNQEISHQMQRPELQQKRGLTDFIPFMGKKR